MNLYLYLKHFPYDGERLNEGTRKAVHGLASGLASHNTNVIILCEGKQNSYLETKYGYKIACFANKQLQPCFFIAPVLKQYICDNAKNSLVILNGIFHQSVYSFSRFLEQHHIPYVVAPHDPYHPTIFQKNAHLKWPYWYLLEKRMLTQAKAIQVLDIRHAEWLRRLGINTPVIDIPNGFSPNDIIVDFSVFKKINKIPKLFFLGRLDAHNKGLDILIDAFAKIIQKADCHLTIQGPDWGDRKYLEAKATKLKLTEKISFLEPDFDISPSSIIANYDIFCIPSRFEGFSLAALEAMLAGRVLLISEVAGIAPHVQASGCGIVVKPEISDIELGILELLFCRSEWQKMGMQGKKYALENLDWNKIANNALNSYISLCENL